MEIEPTTNEIAYQKIICPGSMRSSYWKFFGFPADASGTIITRTKIICSICKAALSYNKNTTNLRSHLNSKHARYLQKHPIQSSVTRTKFIYIGGEKETIENDTTIIKSEADCVAEDTEHLIGILTEEVVEEDPKYAVESTASKPDFVDVEYLSNFSEEVHYKIEETHPQSADNNSQIFTMPTKAPFTSESYQDAVKSLGYMICGCLLPPSIIDETDFKTFVRALAPTINLPTSEMVLASIKEQHKDQSEQIQITLASQLKEKHFCLGLENWTNVQHRSFVSVTLFYVKGDKLESQFIGTVDSSNQQWNNYFKHFNMEQCSAAVLNVDIGDDHPLTQFLISNNVAIIPCFTTIIASITNKCFYTQTVSVALKKAQDFVSETSEMLTSNLRIPDIDERYWQTKYDFFEFFTEIYFNAFDVSDIELQNLCADIKTILECLKPLKLTVEIILSEQVALCSLLKPLVQQLLDSNFTVFETDSDIEIELKSIVQEELEKCVAGNRFLVLASFLDPRLQTFISEESEIEMIKNELKIICRYRDEDTVTNIKSEESSQTNQNKKRSGLDLFFGNKEQKTAVKRIKNPFEREINQYREEVNESFDQSPLAWWNDFGYLYPHLKRAVDIFNCVPATLQNRNFTTFQFIKFQNQRETLCGDVIDPILWLNQNRHSD